MTSVCWFGAWDPSYPRNRILREGLRGAGVEVIEARVRETRAFRRYPALLAAWRRVARASDVLLVPEFRHKDVPLARALAGRRPLVFDPLVSRWDTLVGDWRIHARDSLQARWNRALDGWSMGAADIVLCDTWAHGQLFESLGVPRNRLRRVLVGAEEAFFALPPPPDEGPVRVLYVGGFLPLHGVRTMIEAFADLEGRHTRLPEWEAHLVGTGIDHDWARREARRLGLRRVHFVGRLPYAGAPRLFEDAHIVLGAFGAGDKAGRVIPHKLWQGAAAGRAIVSGDGPGVREVFQHDRQLHLVPRADAAALAAALALLIGDAPRRARLGAEAHARASELGRPAVLGAELAAILGKAVA